MANGSSSSPGRHQLYWVAVVIALVLVVFDIFKGAAWTNVGALIFIVAAIFLRPGGLTRGH